MFPMLGVCVFDPWWERFHMWHGAARKLKKQMWLGLKSFQNGCVFSVYKKVFMMVNLHLSLFSLSWWCGGEDREKFVGFSCYLAWLSAVLKWIIYLLRLDFFAFMFSFGATVWIVFSIYKLFWCCFLLLLSLSEIF